MSHYLEVLYPCKKPQKEQLSAETTDFTSTVLSPIEQTSSNSAASTRTLHHRKSNRLKIYFVGIILIMFRLRRFSNLGDRKQC